jgi:hypothetical protein
MNTTNKLKQFRINSILLRETGKIVVEERAFNVHQCHLLMKVKMRVVTPILGFCNDWKITEGTYG